MRRRLLVFSLILVCCGTLAATAADTAVRPRLAPTGGDPVLSGGQPEPTKAARDTVYLLGGPDRTDGSFEEGWNGWTSVDFTAPAIPGDGYWQVSQFNADGLGGHGAGNHALWCGTYFGDDPGYGNGWEAALHWDGDALGAGESTTLRVTAWLNHDTEVGYDHLYLQVLRDQWETVTVYNGAAANVAVDETVVVESEGASTPVRLRWYFVSDSWGSDQDGGWPSDGACQIDDLAVYRDGELLAMEDFESGPPASWYEVLPSGVGDYAAIYSGLQDLDPCASNDSHQVAFVDDGVVVPGTGGSFCVTWCYGPGGYIVNNTGGLLGPDSHLRNGIVSPAVALPPDLDGLDVAFDVFDAAHDFSANDTGIFHNWSVRSTADADPAALELANWVDRGFFYQGSQRYERGGGFVADMMVTGARWMQLCLEVCEWGYLWGLNGTDGHPAPYFDNAAIKAYEFGGPFVTTRAIELAQDTFPAVGDLDLDDLAANSCRFDMAQNISLAIHLRNDPGDSLVVSVRARDGGTLVDAPRMVVAMRPNPLFDAVRILPAGFAVTPTGTIKGTVDGWLADAGSARWAFDLPDTAFFYPGDEIHYFFEAVDERDGQTGLTRLPADTTGFECFTGNQAVHSIFPPAFISRALPTVFDAVPGDQPEVLFWDDGGDDEAYVRWRWALADAGYNEGVHYDVYRTQSPASGVGNGLGGRATSAQLQGYRTLLYTCGDQTVHTLGNGDFDDDPSLDIAVLSGWFAHGDRGAFMTGDNLVSDLLDAGSTGAAFVNNHLGVHLIDPSIRPLIANQTAPVVLPIEGNPVLATVSHWVAYGGCPELAEFDAVTAGNGAVRLAQFTDPSGTGDVYSYAAAAYCLDPATGSRVVSLPYALWSLTNAPDWTPPAGRPARARSLLLADILVFLGHVWYPPIAAPDAVDAVTVSAYPNPFNPRCTIALSLPRAAEATVKIYDLRGSLVRTLHQGDLAAGRHELTWAGDTDAGAGSASGVYFYEVRAGGERRLGKLTLLK